jgi:hypothetical protein
MQIINADPRDRRGSRANRAMLSVLHGLGAGETPAKVLEDARAEKAAADAALAAIMAGTARDERGIPAWSAGGANIQPGDLPAYWSSSDAAALTFDNVKAAIFGIVNSRDVRRYIDSINVASAPPAERFAAWIWSRLYSRPGWPDGNLFASIKAAEDDDEPTFFSQRLSRWSAGYGKDDAPDWRAKVMADPGATLGECGGRRWGACLADIAGQAIRWAPWATKAREDAIKAAADRVGVADGVLKVAEASVPSGSTVPTDGSDKCQKGYALDPLTNLCIAEEKKSALPWILGGAAIVGLLLLRRRQ